MKNIFKIIIVLIVSLKCFSILEAHPAENVARGLQFLEQGRLEDAERELQLARFAAPDAALIAYNLGHVSYRRRNYHQAVDFFSQAAAAGDKELQFNSLHNLGNANYRLGQYAEAIAAYRQGLEIRTDPKTEFNLKQAEEKLKQQMENQEKQQNQENQENQENQQNQKNQSQQNDSNNQQQQGQKDPSGSNSQEKPGNEKNQDNQQKEGQPQQSDQDKSTESGQSQENRGDKEESAENRQPGNEEKDSEKEDKEGQGGQSGEEERKDVEMAQPSPQEAQPQESQRARALKNQKLNPYMVEKLMRQLQEREKQAQLYYRNEPQRRDEADPFNMNAQQLQEFFHNRGRKKQESGDDPDW